MPVTCPHCSARYTLPASLLGPGGARVRCPKCKEPFGVGPDGIEVVPLPEPAGNRRAKPEPVTEVSQKPVETAPPAEVSRGVVAVKAGSSPRPAAAPVAETPVEAPVEVLETPAMVAKQVIEDLAAHSGPAMRTALASGRLFAEFGDVIAGAFEAYRLRVGSDADPAPFRAALRDQWAVDLDPGVPPSRLM